MGTLEQGILSFVMQAQNLSISLESMQTVELPQTDFLSCTKRLQLLPIQRLLELDEPDLSKLKTMIFQPLNWCLTTILQVELCH